MLICPTGFLGISAGQKQRLSLANMVIATNSDELHNEVYKNVLERCLRVSGFGPAEYFTQMSDRMTRVREDNLIGLDVMLSGVSVTTRRAQKDFWDGLDKLHEIYQLVATEHLVPDLRAQLFTRMGLDKPIEYLDRPGSTPLPENGPTFVDGSALVRQSTMAEVIRVEMEALVGDRRTLEGFMQLLDRDTRTQIEESRFKNPERL